MSSKLYVASITAISGPHASNVVKSQPKPTESLAIEDLQYSAMHNGTTANWKSVTIEVYEVSYTHTVNVIE